MAGEYRYPGVNRVDRVKRGPRRNLAFTRMLRSWVEQYFSDLVSEIPRCRQEEGDDIYGDDDTVHLNIEIGDRCSSWNWSRRQTTIRKGPRVCYAPGDGIKGDVDESTFIRINHWIRCQV